MSTNTTSVWRKKLKELEIIVVIPTYNNGKTLAAVIEEVCRYAGDIIVINDALRMIRLTFWNNIRLSALLPILSIKEKEPL